MMMSREVKFCQVTPIYVTHHEGLGLVTPAEVMFVRLLNSEFTGNICCRNAEMSHRDH